MMKKYFKFSLFFASLLFIGANLFAVPAYPELIKFVQPDGSKVNIYLKGDEYVKWGKSEDGYTLMYNDDGFFVFAQYNQNGDMVPSEHIAKNIGERDVPTNLFLRNLPKDIFYSDDQMNILMQIRSMRSAENAMQQSYPTTGNRKLLCILIGFTDKSFTKTQAEFNNLFNQVGYSTGGATGSVKDYYLENSYGQFNLTVDVAGPYTASNTMAYYGGNDGSGNDLRPRELVREAVLLADPYVNYADYDNDNDGYVDGIYVIYAGYGEEAGGGANAIWAHQWALSSPVLCDGKYVQKYSCSAELRGNSGSYLTRIGVICHEFGHVLGAPDYYDVDYTTGGSFEGMGDWCIMAGGSWNNNGATPAHHNGFTKVALYDWATATTLNSATNVLLHNAAENSNSFYRFNTTTNNEYYFIENRHKHLFDAAIPGSGMMIYHVHKDVLTAAQYNNINNTHPQKMYPVSQNATSNPSSSPSSYGDINSANCAWTGVGKSSFTDSSMPSAKSWAGANTNKPITDITHNPTAKTVSFCFINCVTDCTQPTLQASNVNATNIQDNQLRLNWTRGNGNGVLVLARKNSAVNSNPMQGITYNANASFGSGDEVGNGNFVVYKGTGNNVTITGLTAGTNYHFSVYEYRTIGTCYKIPSANASATTTGIAPCEYCYAYGNTQYGTSITGVSFNTINKTSGKETDGNGNAYSDYTNISTDLMKGLTYPLSIKTDSDGNYYTKTNVWIDWNGNCEFDEDEIYEFGYTLNSSNTEVDGSPRNITIPENAITGPTRMRVAVKYINTSNIVDPTPCNQGIDGEVEDYTINIIEEPNCTPPTTQANNLSVTNIQDYQMRLNWTRGNGTSVLVVAKKSSAVDVDPYQSLSYEANSSFGLGDDLGSGNIVVYKGTGTNVTVTSLQPATTYHFAVYEFFTNDNCYKKPAAVYSATTTGSALCSYCYSYGITAIGAGITGVTLNTIDKISGKETDANGNVYSDYTYLSTELTRGESYQLTVKLNAGGNYNNAAKVWIDWNGNCEFEDSEGYDLGSAPTAINGATSNSPLTITVPADAVLGYTRMRVSMMYNNPNDNIPPTQCQEGIYGEVEDYSIFIKSSCEPVVITTQAVEYQELCRPVVANLSVEAEGAGLITYQWQYLLGETWYNVTNNYPSGATYSNAQTQNLSISGITATGNHSYRVVVSNCNGEYIVESDIANIIVVSTPARPSIISGPTTVCQGDENIDYSVTNVNGITYTWSYSGTGVSFTGQGTNSISATFSEAATSGTWTVVPSNTCGDGQSRTRSITVNPLPNQTSDINGANMICAGETNISYSVTNVSGINYQWSYSGNGATISGQGTNTVSINYSPTATSGTLTVVPSNSCGNGVPTSMDVEINYAPQVPTAVDVQSVVCQGETNVIYSVEEEDVTYTWSYSGTGATFTGQGTASISVDYSTSATSGTWTVTPSNGCGNGPALNMSIVVNELPVQPSIITGETSICPGANGIEYSVTNIPGTAFSWSYSGEGASIFGQGTNSVAINFEPTATSGVLSVVSTNNCGSSTPRTLNIDIQIPQTPLFDDFGPYCHNVIADILPTISNNGISGTWNPENISTLTTGNHSYIFTPSAEYCANTVEITVEITEKATPHFNITTSYCPNAIPDALPVYSVEGIGGQWSPSAINTSIMGNTVYTFTPNDGECANEVQITVEVGEDIVPQFEDFGPYCHNETADVLPEISLNGIPGTWSPSAINTAIVGEVNHIFTPDEGQCASNVEITVEVMEKQNPNFDLQAICHNDENFTLPNISTNGISGVWTPAVVNTEFVGTETYTFTPDDGECANTIEIEIEVEEVHIPTFADFGPYCQGDNAHILPVNSQNQISGVWTPESIDTEVVGETLYTFTPNQACASEVEIIVNIKAKPQAPVITENNYMLTSNVNSGNQWYLNNELIQGATNKNYLADVDGSYYATVIVDGCESDASNVIVIIGNSISENNSEFITIYPNPFEEKLIIELTSNIETAKIQIYNTLGQILYSEQAQQRTVVNTQDFATGVYFIKIENKEISETVKMIKK
ncbi:MAG: M6 family metalloprotease domain-containing protein [Bacteroidales bacterium]|nr:M6 family metalloprotease domain-containing protein [Bacteroidales bacterium]